MSTATQTVSDEELVFKALASPHRRRVLDMLRDGPRTTGAISDEFGELSRYAVMQHLGVLTDAGLVVVRRQGRERWNHLNAVGVRRVYERWVSRLAGAEAERLLALGRFVEGRDVPGPQGRGAAGPTEGGTMDKEFRTVRLEHEMRFDAPRERVFAALVDEQQKWFPYSYGQDRLKGIVFEKRVGGQTYEDWGDGAGIYYATVVYWDPPQAVATRGFLKDGITLEQWQMLETDGEATILKASTLAVGPISDEEAEGIRVHGHMKNFEDALHAWIEKGVAATPA